MRNNPSTEFTEASGRTVSLAEFESTDEEAKHKTAARRQELAETNSKYHVGNLILWPSFSSTSEDPGIALGYATKDLEKGQAAVVLKIVTRRVMPLKDTSMVDQIRMRL